MAEIFNSKIFKLNRIKFNELWDDALNYITETYRTARQYFNSSSPMSQILSVILHLGRMILFYIEDSITGLNIKTAYREDQIKGLATLTGHNPSRIIAARGGIRISYVNTAAQEYQGQVLYIPNKINIRNKLTGRNYVVLFNADVAKMTLTAANFVSANIIEGSIKLQSGTSSGKPLESFNFTERNYGEIDQYFINVYVNGERWEIKDSLLDMSYNEKACIVKTGMLSGIDVFFGNTNNGMIPPKGAIVRVEYATSSGFFGNLPKEYGEDSQYWEFVDTGYLSDGTTIDLNQYLAIKTTTDIIFGSDPENVALTQMIAPYASRSMVLANETNYKYFFQKMNMFSIVEVISGYNTYSDMKAQQAYDIKNNEYIAFMQNYKAALQQFGSESEKVKEMKEEKLKIESELETYEQRIIEAERDDNTVYLLLIPDIRKRISSAMNYFTCDESSFTLSNDEKASLLDLIEQSKQRIITVENAIIDPLTPKFAINASIKMWDTYKFEDVYNSCAAALSDYLLDLKRRDMIPVSDLVALFENVNGVDSVSVSFDADKSNESIYGKGNYGIDEYGDIQVTRKINDEFGNVIEVRDILPLFRGNFVSMNGVSYSDIQAIDTVSAFNLNLISYSSNRILNTDKSTILA